MPANRYYLDAPLITGETYSFPKEESRHIAQVMRKVQNETIEVTNGKHLLSRGKIVSPSSKQIAILIEESVYIPPKLPELILVQSILSPPKLKLLVQKGTELGISHFLFFPAELGDKTCLSPMHLHTLLEVSKGAIKQCGRLDLPQLMVLSSLSDLPSYISSLLFADTRDNAPPLTSVASLPPHAIAIGPEKGFSKKEVELLTTKLKARGVSIHPYILRSETAAVVSAAALAQLALSS